MQTQNSHKAEVLSYLRQAVQGLEGYKHIRSASMTTGIAEIDQSLPDGSFPLAAIHEFVTSSAEDGAAASGFLSALLSTIAGEAGVILWIVKDLNLFPPSLKIFGLDPDRIIFVVLPKPKEALWAMEEALRCKELVSVVCEIADPDLTDTRRMQLAVEKSGVTGFLLRMNPKKTGSTSCVSRWNVRSLPSGIDKNCPGVGFPRWQLELLKVRNGVPGSWAVEWRGRAFHHVKPDRQAEFRPGRLAVTG